MEQKISACLIVKDEEPCIARCLAALRPHVDEIVVADTGSSDRTAEIAAAFADRVLAFRWRDDFAAARNFCIAAAANDAVLNIDADETVTRWQPEGVARFFASPGAKGLVQIDNTAEEGGEARRSTEWQPRLFDRRFFRYEGIVHEQVVPVSAGAEGARVAAGIALAHDGYGRAEVARKHKTQRNAALLERALAQKGDDCYLLYQLGRCYDLAGDPARALRYYERALPLIPDLRLAYVCGLVTACGYAHLHAGDVPGAAALGRFAGSLGRNPDFVFMLAYADMLAGRFAQAVEGFLRCTSLSGGEREGVTGFLPLYNAGVIYECLGNREQAAACYRRCGGYEKARQRLAALEK